MILSVAEEAGDESEHTSYYDMPVLWWVDDRLS